MAAVHCGESSALQGFPTPTDGAVDASPPPVDAGDAQDSLVCTPEVLAEPHVATTYYVAIDEPGADDDACDGRAPTNEGNGRCPFKDLDAIVRRGLFDTKTGVRVELRAGSYLVTAWEGLVMNGAGTAESESLVISAYAGEKPVVGAPVRSNASCIPPEGGMIPAGCVRQVISVLGTFVIVQGLTIQDGLAYDMTVGGSNHLVRCNKFTYTTPNTPGGSGRSDELKAFAAQSIIVHNEFTHWESQAVDTAGSRGGGLVIEENDFHDPHDRGCGAVGIKFGGRDITVRKNRIHDIAGAECQMRAVLGAGGTGTTHPDDFSAYRAVITENRVWNVNERLATFASCQDCIFERNDASDVIAGVFVTTGMTGAAECAASPTGCRATTGLRIDGNRIRNAHGTGEAGTANFFVGVESAVEATGLTMGSNVYCAAPTAADARFNWANTTLVFDEWKTTSGTDTTSTALATTDPGCMGW